MQKHITSVYYCGAWGKGYNLIPDTALNYLDLLFYSNIEIFPDIIRYNNPKEVEGLNELKKRKSNFPIIASSVGYSAIAKDTDSIINIAKKVTDFAVSSGFDGIDIDWEYPTKNQAYLHDLLIKTFRKELDIKSEIYQKKLYLTCTMPPTDKAFDISFIEKSQAYLDYVNIMTYDIYSDDTTTWHHSAPLSSSEYQKKCPTFEDSVNFFISKGIDPAKILGGAAFYSRIWNNVPNINNGLNVKCDSVSDYGPNYRDITADFITDGNYVKFRDETTKAPWLWNGNTFISYDDEISIQEKCKLVNKYNLAGLMAWEYSLDTDDHTLLKTINQYINQ